MASQRKKHHVKNTDFSNFPGDISMFKTGAGILVQNEGVTEDGLQATFATNLFGHFVLIEELQTILGGSSSSQIVWTSSVNAQPELFRMDDYQHKLGAQPYASSKYATDLISVAINERWNKLVRFNLIFWRNFDFLIQNIIFLICILKFES